MSVTACPHTVLLHVALHRPVRRRPALPAHHCTHTTHHDPQGNASCNPTPHHRTRTHHGTPTTHLPKYMQRQIYRLSHMQSDNKTRQVLDPSSSPNGMNGSVLPTNTQCHTLHAHLHIQRCYLNSICNPRTSMLANTQPLQHISNPYGATLNQYTHKHTHHPTNKPGGGEGRLLTEPYKDHIADILHI